jgi:transcription factor TFIIIB component B''
LAAGRQVVDELDEAHDNGGLAEPPGCSVDEEDNDYEPRGDEESDDENRVEIASRKKRASKKSKEPVTENEKPVRKRNRSNDTPEQSTQKPCKKFSHSTRRNKRCGNLNICVSVVRRDYEFLSKSYQIAFFYTVNKDLLNMPEDEIDFKRLPIRDIILFAEYKERLAVCVPPSLLCNTLL